MRNTSSQELRLITGGIILLALSQFFIPIAFGKGGQGIALARAAPFSGYFLLGFVLTASTAPKPRPWTWAAILAFALLTIFSATRFLAAPGADIERIRFGTYFYQPLSLTMMAATIPCFLLFRDAGRSKSLQVRALLRLMAVPAPYTLGIYILHAFPAELTSRLFEHFHPNQRPAFLLPLASIGVFAVSWFATYIMARIPFLRRTII